jgi:cobalt/nickel transport system permease protein
MHIPDGYISPATAATFYAAAAPFWYVAGQKLKKLMSGQTVPLLAIFAAFSFTIMMFNIPIPGGTTAHAVGATLCAIVLGPWAAVVAVSVALIIQALFFGDGGITAIGANCFNMAIVMPFVGYGVYLLISRRSALLGRRRVWASAIGAYVGINASALLVALELGIQPHLWSENGHALYAPYGLRTAIPAVMAAHLTLAGAAEAIATGFAVAYIQRAHPELLDRAKAAPQAVRRRVSRGFVGLVALILLAAPLGLLATGDAWGEWGAEDVNARIGYVPSGMHRYEGIWRAPFPDYAPVWIPADASFFQQAVAYILSAVIAIGLLMILALSIRILVRRSATKQSSALSA